MPRRSIILQELEENDKKLNSYNQAVEGYNAESERRNANYNNAVQAYNAWMERIKAGQDTGLYRMEDGRYAQLGSHQGEYAYSNRDPRSGQPYDARQMYNSLGELQAAGTGQQVWGAEGETSWQPASGWVRNADGTATLYKDSPATTREIGPDEPGYVPPYFTYENGPTYWAKPDGTVTSENPNLRPVAAAWNPESSLRIIEEPTAPSAPPTPEEPDFYTMSRREEQELVNPTANAAEAALAANRGAPAKTELANQASTGLAGAQDTSAFAERDREESIKQSGILARVLAGQIA